MEWLQTLQVYLSSLTPKKLYQTLGSILACIILTIGLLFFIYYRKVSTLQKKIGVMNETREQIQLLLEKAHHVKTEQKTIDAILAQDTNFKIAGYFEQLLNTLNLASKKTSKLEVMSPDQEGKYQESVLQAKFSAISMKELTDLLTAVDTNQRVFIKELEITSSKKTPNTIDVLIKIATLEPKDAETISGE